MELSGIRGIPAELHQTAQGLESTIISRLNKAERVIASLALGAASLGTFSAGVLELNQREQTLSIQYAACDEVCMAPEPGLQAAAKPTDISPTLAPNLTPPAAPKTRPQAPVKQQARIEMQEVPEYPDRAMPYAEFRANAKDYLSKLPTLMDITRFPSIDGRAPLSPAEALRQLAYIAELERTIIVTPQDYAAFKLDTRFNKAFKGVGSYHKEITPRFFIIHWTAHHYDGPLHLAQSMRPNRIAYFIDQKEQTYQMFENDRRQPAHALGGMNFISQGVEIEATGMMDYKPGQIKQAILLAVDFCRRNGLDVNESTIVGHMAADAIFRNEFYNPKTGKFTFKALHKIDPPQELMAQVIVPQAIALDKALGPR